MNDRFLINKTAVVTGAGQGVGQGIAISLAERGATVALLGRSLEKLETSRNLIEQAGGKAITIAVDVKNAGELAAAIERVVNETGGIQILVNNAQEVPLGALLAVAEEKIEAGWQSGPMATLRLMKLCYPYLRGDGVIINLASSVGMRWDMSGYGAYAAVKEAIRSISRAAACEWGAEGIRCNVILPHAMSPGLKTWTENRPQEAAEFIASIPLRRIGECKEDIGDFVSMLCSDHSRYVNGQTIALDGGQARVS
ncbi:SDR family oxidoreductase [uncultured Zhongshania sp.]|jgi:NAD(P)-dependent dehydrogenase (short-subunit alcohol dehydrogenase family)|uniref:SDR family NAD(P)-dependent oxidoreductase n=1 Tax=uncultured Zhongshania sp. TaxID=1642288 RepID=UPI0025D2C522|nr:SDR family oxidoreductase [uncultured Zhongshania sp.]